MVFCITNRDGHENLELKNRQNPNPILPGSLLLRIRSAFLRCAAAGQQRNCSQNHGAAQKQYDYFLYRGMNLFHRKNLLCDFCFQNNIFYDRFRYYFIMDFVLEARNKD